MTRPRLQLCALLFAWFMATGSQWDVVQVLAWGRMFAGYAQKMPLTSAFRRTFEPENLCSICKAVKTAKQQQEQAPAAYKEEMGKILLAFAPVPIVVMASAPKQSWPACIQIVFNVGRSEPPTPPPQIFAT